MVRGLYTAYTGMMNQQARLDVITNNLANASTVGYKKEGSTSQAFDSMYTQKIKDGSEGYINRRIGKESLGVKMRLIRITHRAHSRLPAIRLI